MIPNEILIGSAFSPISMNEVGGNPATADKITAPQPNLSSNGNGGWTIGFNQEDFHTNSTQSQQTLISALVASGDFGTQSATNIAVALTNAGTSGNVGLNGILDVNGVQATLSSINSALATSASAASIYQSSLNDFTGTIDTVISGISGNPNLNVAVQSALADPTQGPLLQIVLADYANQYGISSNGPMMQLLTSGSTTQNGNAIGLNTTNAATVTQSVMTMARKPAVDWRTI